MIDENKLLLWVIIATLTIIAIEQLPRAVTEWNYWIHTAGEPE